MSGTGSDNGPELERIARDIAETEFLASVEVTTGAARIMEWMESFSSIQRRSVEDWVNDWRQTGTAIGNAEPWTVWLDHAGRRIAHLSASALEVIELNDREVKRMLQTHQTLSARRD
jgi:hypothetical protein